MVLKKLLFQDYALCSAGVSELGRWYSESHQEGTVLYASSSAHTKEWINPRILVADTLSSHPEELYIYTQI